ncbi:Hsp20 family protein [Staphylococcus succinus]|uniref:Hsp20 family protein n=1 Tax=Staphylococcus succinus TaxID=61015 RepID=UPI00062B551B|nr:Hsp20 family protein [Staphylococcus succinus]MDH9160226.1 Hsp20 family protein [Staphylococcus succinus]MEB8123389.1 Hsp20 family protein [Staphylococcus succinus]PNZ17937.1 heat-shock protein [Staphylococcus succinus subsp. succinus]
MIQNTSTRNLPNDLFDSLLPERQDFKVDVYQDENQYFVKAELPGFNKENVSIEYNENTLTITASNVNTTNEEISSYIIKERNTSEVSRKFIFKNINDTNISASMADGMLTVKLPKKQYKKQIIID